MRRIAVVVAGARSRRPLEAGEHALTGPGSHPAHGVVREGGVAFHVVRPGSARNA